MREQGFAQQGLHTRARKRQASACARSAFEPLRKLESGEAQRSAAGEPERKRAARADQGFAVLAAVKTAREDRADGGCVRAEPTSRGGRGAGSTREAARRRAGAPAFTGFRIAGSPCGLRRCA